MPIPPAKQQAALGAMDKAKGDVIKTIGDVEVHDLKSYGEAVRRQE
jgi:hypothetical protein